MKAPACAQPMTGTGTAWAGATLCIMIAGKIAFAAGAFAASLMSGVGLGGYTIGGFRTYQPADLIAEMAPDGSDRAFVQAPPPPPPAYHVCKGCDAKLYRDVDWYAGGLLPPGR